MALKVYVFGKKIIVDLNTKRGYRISPPANARARAIGKCARGKSLTERKKCFETVGGKKGKGRKGKGRKGK